MTKNVRIENADAAPVPIRVLVQHYREGVWEDAPDIAFHYLPNPTDLCTEYIHKHRRIIIQEG